MRVRGFLIVVVLAACGSRVTPPAQGDPAVLVDETAELSPLGMRSGPFVYKDFAVEVPAGTRVAVSLTSSAFDPVLRVMPPGGEALTNDDWQGSRQASFIEAVAPEAGTLKVRVTSYSPTAAGSFRVQVRRAQDDGARGPNGQPMLTWPSIREGQTVDGELAAGDQVATDGSWYDAFVIEHAAGATLVVRLAPGAGATAMPRAVLLDPLGRALSPAPDRSFSLTQAGSYRLHVLASGRGQRVAYRITASRGAAGAAPVAPVLARNHHQLPPFGVPMRPITLGQEVTDALSPSDSHLPTGEPADVYSLEVRAAQQVTLDMDSSAIDPYVMVVGPTGEHWENDDSGGSRNASLTADLPSAGTYRVIATAYEATNSGPYHLKVSEGSRGTTGALVPPGGGNEQRIRGSLEQGDRRLRTGELVDEHAFRWPPGATVHVEATSSAFDTYVIVRAPSGAQQDNDDAVRGNTNAALDYTVRENGEHHVLVTSYQSGEHGAYELVVRGPGGATTPGTQGQGQPGQPPPQVAGAGVTRGALAAGDARLRSGEWNDTYSMRFDAGSSIRLRLVAQGFDPYLIVHTPSGRQLDNDDLDSSTRDAGLDVPVAEAGEYRIVVTSYQPGETGSYELRTERGTAVPGATPNGSGGQVWGLFAGITDYPAGTGDLAECANDAIKLAEALRQAGLLVPERQIVLTNAQVTPDGVRNAMRRMATQAGPNDVFVFFYSGHGNRHSGTHDSREIDDADETLVLYGGEMIDDELGQLFDAIHARVSVVALDSCFAGGFAKDVITRPGRVGLFSSEEDVTSSVADQFQAGGYLSHFLRLAMRGDADNDPSDRVLTVGEMTHFVWNQFGHQASDVRMSMGYQHLVVDRGAVGAGQVLWAYRR